MMGRRRLVFISAVSSFVVCLVFVGFMLILCKVNSARTPKEIYRESLSSVVELKSTAGDGKECYGSAVVMSDDGRLVTNAHLVMYKQSGIYRQFKTFEIRSAYEESYEPAALLKYDMTLDIAVLQVKNTEDNHSFLPVKTGDSAKLKTGNRVYAIGNALNQGISITQGIISLAQVDIEYEGIIRNMIQCDLTINEGNSGGALLNKDGKMIGMPSFRLKEDGEIVQGLAYCIPMNLIASFYQS